MPQVYNPHSFADVNIDQDLFRYHPEGVFWVAIFAQRVTSAQIGGPLRWFSSHMLTATQDVFAILLAAYHPGIRLLGISTVFGNAPLEYVSYHFCAQRGKILTSSGPQLDSGALYKTGSGNASG